MIFPAFLSMGVLLASLGLPITPSPDPAGVLIERANSLRSQGKPQEAVDAFDEAIRLNPSKSEAYLGRASAHEALQQPALAEEDYKLAIRAEPKSAKSWVARAQARVGDDRFEEAIRDYDVAVGLDPYNDEMYYARGNACLNSGRYEQAVADYTHALALALKGSDMVTDCYANRCSAYNYLKRYEEALADNERARQAGHEDDETKAQCLTHLKRFKEALALFERMLTPSDPDSDQDEERPKILRQRAGTRIAMQDFPGAEKDLAEANRLRPATSADDGNLSWNYVLARRPVEAQATARRAIATGEAEGWIYINLADACLLDGKVDEARDIYLKYVGERVISGKTGLQAIKEDFADMREVGIDLPAMKSIEALLPREVHPAPAPKMFHKDVEAQFLVQ